MDITTWLIIGVITGAVGMGYFVYGKYVDEVVAYQQTVNGVTSRYYPHYNHLYSVAALTNAAGQVVERFKYDAYGRQTITSATGTVRSKSAVGFNRGFTGYVADNESGLLYARNRMYSPGLGVFLSRNTYGRSVGWKYTSATAMGIDVDLVFVEDDNVRQNYIDGYSMYISPGMRQGVDPSGEPVSITFSDGRKMDINTGTGKGDALALIAELKKAGAGSITAIEIYGHANPREQTFNSKQTDNSGMTVRSDPTTGQDTFPVTWAPSGYEIGAELDRVLTPDGQVGLNGCNSAAGKNSITERLSKRLGKKRRVTGFCNERWRGPDYKKPEKCESTYYENGVQGPITKY